MGYMRHNAIVVTAPMSERMVEVHTVISGLAARNGGVCDVTPLTKEAMNGYVSFLVASDGSKEGWDTSEQGDRTRDEIIEYLNTLRYSDGSSSFRYVEVQYGDDERQSKVLRHSEDGVPA